MSARIGRQKRVLEFMVRYYCARKHGRPELCPDCASLSAYAVQRLEHCRYGDAKPACSRCATHCYGSGERERIRELMRFSGPRMLFRMPLEALAHALAQALLLMRVSIPHSPSASRRPRRFAFFSNVSENRRGKP